MANTRVRQNPFSFDEQIKSYFLRIANPATAAILWELLTDAERDLLGNDLEKALRNGGIVGLWRRLKGVSAVRAILEVALMTNHIDQMKYQRMLKASGDLDDPGSAFDYLVRTAQLVLREGPREAYWKGEKIDMEWTDAVWVFLWKLCEYSIKGNGLDHTSFGATRDRAYPHKLRHRLLKQLPAAQKELNSEIISGGRNTLILKLKPEEIRLFEITLDGTLRERR